MRPNKVDEHADFFDEVDKVKIILRVNGIKYAIWASLDQVNEDTLNLMVRRLLDKINEHRNK